MHLTRCCRRTLAPPVWWRFPGGNHGAALAYAATKLGVDSTIFSPDWSGPTKIERMRAFGATVIVLKDHSSVIIQKFMDYADRTGALAVHPFDDPFVVSGQGTTGLEIDRQLPDLNTLMVSVGGGGLISGITRGLKIASKSLRSRPKARRRSKMPSRTPPIWKFCQAASPPAHLAAHGLAFCQDKFWLNGAPNP